MRVKCSDVALVKITLVKFIIPGADEFNQLHKYLGRRIVGLCFPS